MQLTTAILAFFTPPEDQDCGYEALPSFCNQKLSVLL
jgi:hypothetical protein